MGVEIRHGICRFCHVICPLKLTIDNGRITNIIGDKNNPVYHGYSCIKGRNYHHFHSSPDRVLRPQKRNAAGELEDIQLDQATGEIAARLQSIIDRHGARSVAMFQGAYSHLCVGGVMTRRAFMNAIGSPMSFDNSTIDQPGKPIAMALHGRWGAGPQAFADSDVCLVVGANPLVSMWGGIPPFNPARRLHRARKRGLKLIVIDPRRSESARKAALHLQCLPGHDPQILAAMINVIIEEKRYDAAFVAEEANGFAELSAAVRNFSPERVAAGAGLDTDEIVTAARMFAGANKGYAVGGTGPNMAPHGTLTEYLLLALNTLCGRWVRAGEKVTSLGVLYPIFSGVAQVEKLRAGWGFGEKLRVRGLGHTAAGLPTAALADEILTPGVGQVRALLVAGGNPLANWPNREKVARALESLELLVVVDPQMSATTQKADYVIGPKFGFELPAITLATEGMSNYGLSIGPQEPYGQYQPSLIDPPDNSEVIEDWRFFYELARSMGLQLTYRGMIYDMEQAPTTDELIAEFVKRSPVPLEEVKKYPEGHIFEEQSSFAKQKESDWPYKLEIGNMDMLKELAEVEAEKEAAPATIKGDGLSLLLVSRRHHQVYNSVGHNIPALANKLPYNPAFMNPSDAASLSLTSGDPIEISSAIHTVSAIVEVADDIRIGVISIAHGFPNARNSDGTEKFRGSSTAALVDDERNCDPISGMPVMSALPVNVRAKTGIGSGGKAGVDSSSPGFSA
jgi:anaerobic selenocysteine-containing dehydrogenase